MVETLPSHADIIFSLPLIYVDYGQCIYYWVIIEESYLQNESQDISLKLFINTFMGNTGLANIYTT